MSPTVTALGALLRSRREGLGYSRTRAAELSGLNASSLEAWELGRVAKPPIHDVLRLARVLSISTPDLERAVMEDGAPVRVERSHDEEEGEDPQPAAKVTPADVASAGIPLLERATAVLGWSDEDAAAALNTSTKRMRSLRRGESQLSVLEVLSLIALLAAFPAGRGGASEAEIFDLLAQLRRTGTT